MLSGYGGRGLLVGYCGSVSLVFGIQVELMLNTRCCQRFDCVIL